MAASPQVVTTNPLFLNARTGIYTATELRKPLGDIAGSSVADYDSFRVRQRAAGVNMSVDCVTASTLNRAFVRGSITADQGVYRVDYNSASVLNLDVAANASGNPRIDSVYLVVEDQQVSGSNNQATVVMVTGTATGGATLDNRTGAGAAPTGSSILLADILVASGAVSIANAVIRDRRPFGRGSIPPLASTGGLAVDAVIFDPPPGACAAGLSGGTVSLGEQLCISGTHATMQVAVLRYLPRRIVGATRIRWSYLNIGGATGNYALGLWDANGRFIVQTHAVAFTGAAGSIQRRSETISATTLDAGWYWHLFAVATPGANVAYRGWNFKIDAAYAGALTAAGSVLGAPYPGVALRSASGGTTLPNSLTSLTDIASLTATTDTLPMPDFTVSVG